MLGNIMMKVVEMSLVGCYSVLIVLVARGLLWKCERKYSYYLWFIVFLNLSLPFVVESPFSLIPRSLAEFSLERDSSRVQTEQYQDSGSVGLSAIRDSKEEQTWHTREISDQIIPDRRISFQEIAGPVWILGIAVILGVNVTGYLRLKLRIRKGRILSLDKENRIKVVDSAPNAFVCGMVRPWVYLPTGMTEEEKAYITAHEQYHRKRRDYLFKTTALCITAVHWFNPFAWVALLLFCQDMEVSCDEKVLEHTGGQVRKQYAASLLKYAALQNGFLVISLNFGKPTLESRIRNVLKEKRKNILITVAAVIGVLAVAMGLFLRPMPEKQDVENSSLSDEGVDFDSASNEEPASGGTEESDRAEEPISTESPDSLTALFEENQRMQQFIDDLEAFKMESDRLHKELIRLHNEVLSLETD